MRSIIPVPCWLADLLSIVAQLALRRYYCSQNIGVILPWASTGSMVQLMSCGNCRLLVTFSLGRNFGGFDLYATGSKFRTFDMKFLRVLVRFGTVSLLGFY